MSCVLRVAGRNLDVTAFLADFNTPSLRVWRSGERRSPSAKPSETSGVLFQVSAAEFSNLPAQAEDALAFLRVHHEWLKMLVVFPGVDRVVLDFGVESTPPHWASFVFEPSLLAVLGEAGISLELSVYPSAEEVPGNA